MNPIIAFIERHQRAQRFRRMLSVSPELRKAHEALERDRRQHKATRADIMAKRNALHEMLRRKVAM